MADLTERGYYCLRSAGSHSKIDVVAAKNGKVLFIQCKIGGVISTKDWNILYGLCREGLMPIVAENVRGKVVYMELKGVREPRKKPWVEVEL